MKELASKMREAGVRPGIWVRYLIDSRHEIKGAEPHWYLERDPKYLDPSVPEDFLRTLIRAVHYA